MNNGIFVNSPLNATQRDRLSHITNTMPRGIVLPSPYTVEMPFHFPPYRDWLRSNEDIVLICNTTIENNLIARVPALSNNPFFIDWGDGTIIRYSSSFAFISYTYQYHGTYTIRVIGATSFGNYEGVPANVNKFTALLSTGKATINAATFRQWGSLRQVPQSPVLGSDLTGLFYSSGFNLDIGSWNMSNVTTFYDMFAYGSFNNGGSYTIKNWNTSSATNMTTMFVGNTAFNQPLDNWNVRKVTSFISMFNSATNFNGSLSGWAPGADTAGTNCTSMFQDATNFIGDGLNSWTTSNITNMNSMFNRVSKFNQPLNNWNVAKVTDFSYMFQNTSSFNSSLSGWSLGTSTTASIPCVSMFQSSAFNQPINDWNVSRVTNMQQMFTSSSFNQPINNWNVSNVTNMQQMFQTSAFNQNLDSWGVSKVTNMNNMFLGSSFNGSVSGWIPGSGCNCSSMFQGSSFTGSGLDTWDATKLGNISFMFAYNNNASSIAPKIVNWNLCNCTNMTGLFFFVNMGNNNYDNILNSWSVAVTGNPIKNWATNLTPHFGNAKYTAAGSAARASLISYGWTITDGGAA